MDFRIMVAVLLLLCFAVSAYSPTDKPNSVIFTTNWVNSGWNDGAALSKALTIPNEGALSKGLWIGS